MGKEISDYLKDVSNKIAAEYDFNINIIEVLEDN